MPLDPKRVQAVFWQAVQYSDPADRALILERECSGDAELWERVVALLRAHDEYTSLLNEPAFILPAWAPGLLAKPDDEVAQDTAAGRAEPAPDRDAGRRTERIPGRRRSQALGWWAGLTPRPRRGRARSRGSRCRPRSSRAAGPPGSPKMAIRRIC
jgi:hypothetical protein